MVLSVIVPVYNMAGDGKLRYCMDSLVGQTIPDYEILAVDDCSQDESYGILKEYEERFPGKVRALRTDRNRRQGGAKNLGLSQAKGDWIGFVDADDWIVPDYYERLLGLAKESGADMVGCDYCLTGEHSGRVGQIVHNNRPEQTGTLDEAKYRSLILDSGSLVVKIYRREIILGCESRFPEDMFYEDNAIANTWMLRATCFAYLPEPLYYYYQHEGSTVHTITRERLEDRMRAGRRMLEEAERYGYLERYRPEIMISFTTLFYVNTLFSAMPCMRERGKYAFVRSLARQMRETFPEFQENPYYRERVGEEERRLIAMQMRSPLAFYLYYKALWAYRKARKKMGS
ncbi:MAG: glycosyltransferase family 2 protein [Eubacteriales bacterium]|nr:glycosyltransferase family 2 protein [Eubacteriales bacterium]